MSHATPTPAQPATPETRQPKRGPAYYVRRTIFWLHLVCGVIAGIAITLMCFTGVVLAFQNEIIAWAERDARHAAPSPAGQTAPLPIAELLGRARETAPDFRPATLTVTTDPHAAYILSSGGRGTTALAYYQNQYTGELRPQTAPALRSFMSTMLMLHRWLALEGDSRAIGKAVNGACNVAFAILAITGIYLWWPRRWTWQALRPSLVVLITLRGKGRDWNWHNALGFWSTPVLLVLTLTAIPISYRWATNLIYTAFGETPPAASQRGHGPAGPKRNRARSEDNESPRAKPALPADELLARVKASHPDWDLLTLRLSPASGPAAITLRETTRWPRTATTQLELSRDTGDILKRETFSDATPARRFWLWGRFLHTGEALGWPGQFAAGLASAIGLILCYTGFALAFRRFFMPRPAIQKSLRQI